MKKSILISLLLILFLSISAVAAADNVTSTVVSDKTFSAVQTAVDNANETDSFLLEGTYLGNGTAITINKPVTIEGAGNGAKLDAKSSSQIFKIKSDNVVLKNLVIVNGNPKDKAGNDYGGALYVTGDNLKIINCTFSSNSARYGGAVYSNGDNVSIIDCKFSNNYVDYTGAAFELDGNGNYVSGCTFTSNVGYHAGGDVAWVGLNGILENCQFASVNSKSKASQFGGAVVWMGANGQLLKSSFSNYYAKRYGSAVYWKGANGTLNYNIFLNTDNTYWGNPDYASNNYWGLNINSTEEFTNKKLIYNNNDFTCPQNWVNIVASGDYINFTSNDGTELKDYLPDYQLNSTVLIANNSFKFKKDIMLTCQNLVTYSMYNGKYLKVVLCDANGEKLASKDVILKFNGNTYSKKTDRDGAIFIQVNIKNPGTYTASVSFNGDDDYKPNATTSKITVKKQKTTLTFNTKTLKLKSKTKVVKVVLKNQFKKAVSKMTVKLTINKKTYTAKTNSKGIASFKVSLKNKKTYKATVKFLGNGNYYKTSKTASIKVK